MNNNSFSQYNDENNSAQRKSVTLSVKKALGQVNTNILSTADPDAVNKSSRRFSEDIPDHKFSKVALKKPSVHFTPRSEDERKPLIHAEESPVPRHLSPVAQTPGNPTLKLKAGHTPFNNNSSMNIDYACPQDSFMIHKFAHDYGVHHDYKHDYSMLDRSSSSLSQTMISNSFNSSMHSFDARSVISSAKQSDIVPSEAKISPSISNRTKESDNATLEELLAFPESPEQQQAGDSPSQYAPSPSNETPLSSFSQEKRASYSNHSNRSIQPGLSASYLLQELSGFQSPAPVSEISPIPLTQQQPQSGRSSRTPYLPSLPDPSIMNSASVNADICAENDSKLSSSQERSVHLSSRASSATRSSSSARNENLFDSTPFTSPSLEKGRETLSSQPREERTTMECNSSVDVPTSARSTRSAQATATVATPSSQDFDLEYLRGLREKFQQGKISEARSKELMAIFYELGESMHTGGNMSKHTGGDVHHYAGNDESVIERTVFPTSQPRSERSFFTTRSLSASRVERSPSSKSIVDEGVDAMMFSQRRKSSMDDLNLSSRNTSPAVQESIHYIDANHQFTPSPAAISSSHMIYMPSSAKKMITSLVAADINDTSSIYDDVDTSPNKPIMRNATPFNRSTINSTSTAKKLTTSYLVQNRAEVSSYEAMRLNTVSDSPAFNLHSAMKKGIASSKSNDTYQEPTDVPPYQPMSSNNASSINSSFNLYSIAKKLAPSSSIVDEKSFHHAVVEVPHAIEPMKCNAAVSRPAVNQLQAPVHVIRSTPVKHMTEDRATALARKAALRESPGVSLTRPALFRAPKQQQSTSAPPTAVAHTAARVLHPVPSHDIDELNRSEVSLPYMGNNEPSFAKREYQAYASRDRDEVSSNPSPLQYISNTADKLDNDESISIMHSKIGVDVAVQSSFSYDTPIIDARPRSKSVGTSTSFSSSPFTSNILSPALSSSTHNNMIQPQATIKQVDNSSTPYKSSLYQAETSSMIDDIDLSSTMRDLHHTIQRHNLNVPWRVAAPTPASNFTFKHVSKTPFSVSGAIRVPVSHHTMIDDMDSESVISISSLENVLKREFDAVEEDASHHYNNDDTVSLSSTISSVSDASFASPIDFHMKPSSSSKAMSLQSLTHTINQGPPSLSRRSSSTGALQKKIFDVNAVSFARSPPKPTTLLLSSSINKCAMRCPLPRASIDNMLSDASIKKDDTMMYDHNNDHDIEHDHDCTNNHDISADFTCDTTLTLGSDRSLAVSGRDNIHLAVAAKSRSRKEVADTMKEVIMATDPGGCKTLSLTFSNKRSTVMKLQPVMVQTRFDIAGKSKSSKLDTTNFGLDILPDLIAFQVSPPSLVIQPGEEAAVYITFTPTNQYEGFYTGALKIKSKKNTFVILVRGEAFHENEMERVSSKTPTTTMGIANYMTSMHNNPIIERSSFGLYSPSHVKPLAQRELGNAIAMEDLGDTNMMLSTTSNTRSKGNAFSRDEPSQCKPISASMTMPKSATNLGINNINLLGNTFASSKHEVKYGEDEHNNGEMSTIEKSSYRSRTGGSQESYPLHDTPSSMNTTLIADAVIALNKMVDDHIRADNKPMSHSSKLYDYILRPDEAVSKQQQHDEDENMDKRRTYLKDWISRCKVATKGARKYPNLVPAVMPPSMAANNLNTANLHVPTTTTTTARSQASSKQQQGSSSNNNGAVVNDKENHDHNQHNTSESTNQSVVSGESRTESSDSRSVRRSSQGLFFRQEKVQFGSIVVGTITRLKLELCNATNEEVHVVVGLPDDESPFFILHDDIIIRPRSYIRLPIRFVPKSTGTFAEELSAQSSDGRYRTAIRMTGTAFYDNQ